MSEENLQYIVPNRAEPLTIVQSNPINQNWDEIQEAINKNYDLASRVENKIDISEKGVEGGVATLDINNKLNTDQIPDEAKGHVYEVANLAEQLLLPAFTGDICVRKDIGKSYALRIPSPMNFSSWSEIASIQGGGELRANSCYCCDIDAYTWSEDRENNRYFITFDAVEHGQGNTKYLIAGCKNKFGQDIQCDYIVDDSGVCTIYSDVNFEGCLYISNLSGNCDNANIVPYCVVSGYRLNSKPSYLTWSLHSIELVTSVPLIVVDGLNVVRNITKSYPYEINQDVLDGTYVLFADSESITNDTLYSLTSLSLTDYLGTVQELPKTGEEGQRCYVAYDKSYEYENDSWRHKAFVPLGEYVVTNGYISSAACYDFVQNGTNVNYTSHSLDRLFGSEINGLKVTFSDKLSVSPGTCLVDNRICNLTDTLVKDYTKDWQEGPNEGCLDPYNKQVTYIYEVVKDGVTYYTEAYGEINSYVEMYEPVYADIDLQELVKEADKDEFLYNGIEHADESVATGWGYVFLISNNKYDKVDILLSYNESPNLPVSFNTFRRIGYFYRDENLQFIQEKQIKEVSYFYEPQIITTSISTEITDISVNIPPDCDVVFGYKFDEPQSIQLYYENIEIYEEYSKNNTLTLPCFNQTIQISAEQETDVKLRVLGYIDRRQL